MNYHIFYDNNKYYLYLTEYKQAFLISKTEYEEIESDFSNNDVLHKYVDKASVYGNRKRKLETLKRFELYLCVSNDCNARCIYCYAGFGSYGKKRGIMSEKIAYESIDFFFAHVPEDALAIITFFGGEPLLAKRIIQNSCEYIAKCYSNRKKEFHITTNGTLLTHDIIDYFAKYNFRVVVSIDGGSKIHNLQRPLISNADCFEMATRNISSLFERQIPVAARGTYVVGNYELRDAYKDLIDIGFKKINIVPDFYSIKTDDKLRVLIDQLDGLYEYMVSYVAENQCFPFSSFAKRIRQLFGPVNSVNNICGAGESIFAIDLYGDIYPCQRFSGKSSSKIGNIKQKEMLSAFISEKMDCSNCWNNTCSHRCQHVQNQEDEMIQRYYCMYSKKMTEICIRLCTVLTREQLLLIVR
ncbi:MAG: radical SAM protein [Butyrivibrio sp.]|nr:radical SAM protein [Butyrivibrio sp.]